MACAFAAMLFLPGAGGSTKATPLAKWFGALTCPALDGLYSKEKDPPAVKTGADELLVRLPESVLPKLKPSMTVPWYVYDPKTNTALSHIGGDSGVVETLRAVDGPPPVAVAHIDLSQARTKSGLKIGATAQSVVQTLGKPLIVRACGLERYEYSDDNDPHAEQNDLDFTIRNGRVIEIVHTSWG